MQLIVNRDPNRRMYSIQIMRTLTISIAVSTLFSSALADDFGDAQRASSFMAAITVCKAQISPDTKRSLYAKILGIYETPSQVNFMIGQEVTALNRMPAADRESMCAAINDRIKTAVE